MTASSRLPSLLWNVIGGIEQEYANEGAGKASLPPLDIWANLLRAVSQAGTEFRELPATLRLSKRAVRTRMSTALRHGWVEDLELGPRTEIVRLMPNPPIFLTDGTGCNELLSNAGKLLSAFTARGRFAPALKNS